MGFKNLFKKIKNQEKEINHVKMFFYLKKIKIVLFLIKNFNEILAINELDN